MAAASGRRPASEALRFFFYGTLIDADVRRLVLGRHAPAVVEEATLAGWRRVPLANVTYPTIIRDRAGTVDGVLARGLGDAARELLVRYEGDEYELIEVEVATVTGKRHTAMLFTTRLAPGRSLPGSWDIAVWRRRHKRRFLASLARSGAPS